ncbi:PIR protein [Plasmodium vivax]|nr:PIR protein [Plasmodium vivax]
MTGWRGTSNKFLNSLLNYKQPQCITKYINYQREILKQIEALSDPKRFCTNCQKIKKDIIDKNNDLKDCHTYNLLKSELIDYFEIKEFMGKCLEPPNCSYNGASNVGNSSALKRQPENTCGGRRNCNKGAATPQVLAGKLQQVLNSQSSRTNIPARQENINIKQPHAEGEGLTKAKTILDHQNNISITNDSVVVQRKAPDHKGVVPSGKTGQVYIPEQPVSASQHSLLSGLDNSSKYSSPQVNPGPESSANAIAQEKDSEAVNLGNDQHGPQYGSGSALVVQDLRSTTSAGQDSDIRPLDSNISGARNLDEKPPGDEDGIAITLGDRNPGSAVLHDLVDNILNFDRVPSLYSTLTDDRGGGGNYISQAFVEKPVDELITGESTGDNSETPFKKYTTMALAPTGIIMLMTLLTKFTPLGMLFTKKNRNKRNDMKEKIERVLLLESPVATEENNINFAYSPAQYWET